MRCLAVCVLLLSSVLACAGCDQIRDTRHSRRVRSDAGAPPGAAGSDAAMDAGAIEPVADAAPPRDAGAPDDASSAHEDASSVDAAPPSRSEDGGAAEDPIVSVTAGAAHAFARRLHGASYAWGSNAHGELSSQYGGDGPDPRRISLDGSWTGMRAGGSSAETGHTCAIDQGAVWCWGANDYGQLGDGTNQSSAEPVRALGLTDVTELDTGGSHTCALRANGQVMCWGRGDSGQLGSGSLGDELQPAEVASLSNAKSISAGAYHSCATRDDDVVCWGANSYGELGRGDRMGSLTPVIVQGLGRVRAVVAGGSVTCAISLDAHVWCWGMNEYGQLGTGDGGSGNVSTLPVAIQGLEDVAELSLGGAHACARTQGGAAWCWGANAVGQLGDGTKSGRDKPVRVVGLDAVQRIEAGGGFTLALDALARLTAFGNNTSGQLGDGTRTARTRPVPVLLP